MTRIAIIPHKTRLVLALGCALALAGCQRDAASEAQRENTNIFSSETRMAEFALQAMSTEELDNFELEGDYRCTFSEDHIGEPLLLARGPVNGSNSSMTVLVKYGDAIMRGFPVEEGGFAAIRQQGSFDTGGLLIDVATTSDEPAGQGESPPYPAMIRVTQPVYGETLLEGFWTCGRVY